MIQPLVLCRLSSGGRPILHWGPGNKLPAPITVTGPETNVASACLGFGLIQVPRYRVAGPTRRHRGCWFTCYVHTRGSYGRAFVSSSNGWPNNFIRYRRRLDHERNTSAKCPILNHISYKRTDGKPPKPTCHHATLSLMEARTKNCFRNRFRPYFPIQNPENTASKTSSTPIWPVSRAKAWTAARNSSPRSSGSAVANARSNA
jgi:hypothetical protein